MVYYLHSDHLGSTSLTTDASGTIVSQSRYLPYGQLRWEAPTSGATPTDFGFTGQRNDGFGLMDYNARYYSPVLGRFISPDTVVPGVGNPQAWNRYSYVGNNPLNHTDPTGHCIDGISTWICVAAVVIVAVDIADIATSLYVVSNSGDFSAETVGGADNSLALWQAAVMADGHPLNPIGEIAASGNSLARAGKAAGSGAGRFWRYMKEIIGHPSVVKQASNLSCGTACGEMLLKSRGISNITQEMIEGITGAPVGAGELAEALNTLDSSGGQQWVGGFAHIQEASKSAIVGVLNSTGSWIAQMRMPGEKIDHMVIVDGFDNAGNLLIRDPWGEGSQAVMEMDEFLNYWNGIAVWGVPQ